uniref:Peptidase m20 n=2 Tax=Tetraselmis sp. GSL018 TaxID=582737 RepID=A0A061R131_9CHLO
MHSGTYGGSVQNAKHALAELLASFHTRDGRVAVEGFYEGVADPTELDASDIAAFPLDEEAERAELSTYEPVGEPGFSTLERRWLRPTLEVVGMWGGFTGEGLKTVLPAEAHAKLSCRLVPGQTPSDILRKLGRHVERFRPKGCSVDLQPLGGESMAYSLPRDSHAVRMAATALQRATGRSPLLYKAGSTIPAMELLQRFLGVHPVPFGFTLHSFDRLHSPNERFKVSMFELAHRAYVELLFTVAEQHTQHREEL